jgi:hypothetical protein
LEDVKMENDNLSDIRTEEGLLAFIRAVSAVTPGMHRAVASMCPHPDTLASMPREVLGQKIASVSFDHRATTPYDDDEYWMAQSPFNGMWYVFASMPGAGWPTKPVYVLDGRPAWFDED